MTRDELLTAAKSVYTHTMDLKDEDLIIQLAEARIGQQVRAPEQVTYATIDTSSAAVANNAWQLPADYLQMREVFTTISGSRVSLEAVGRDAINNASNSASSQPVYYSIYGDLIEFAPGPGERDITVIYYARPSALVNGTDTNDLIVAHPALYLYAVMQQWQIIAQDSEQLEITTGLLDGEIERINGYGWQQSFGTAPVSRGSGNNYTARGARL